MAMTQPRRRPAGASAAILLSVLLLFGAATFVAGLVVGGGPDGFAGPVPSTPTTPAPTAAVPSEAATPRPSPVVETVSCAQPTEAFAVLCDVYARIEQDYVDDVDAQTLVDGAVRGMIEYGLGDPYSGYLPQSQYERALDDLSGEFSGIGAEVGMENLDDPEDLQACTVVTANCVIVIVAPLDGSPAEAAGLRPGDHILAVDGESTMGESLSTLVFEVRGEAGTDVTLTVGRGDEELDITVTRAVIDLQEVSGELIGDDVAYLRLSSFTDRSTALLRDELAALLERGASGVVLDLRGNPGGFIVAAQGIASQFLPEGELLFTVEAGDDVQRWTAEAGGLASDPSIPLVVLVDGGSASASEIVAAALHETGRATIVGTPTFGKNTVQIWHDLPNGGGLRLTTDRWFTPGQNAEVEAGVDVPAGHDHGARVVARRARGCAGQLGRHGRGTRRFDHEPATRGQLAHRLADLLLADGDDLVEVSEQVRERQGAERVRAQPIGHRPPGLRGGPGHQAAGLQRLLRVGGQLRFHADDPGRRTQRLHRGRHARGQASARHRDEHAGHAGQLLDDLQAARPLAGDDGRVVVRLDHD
jgi:C-terminal peptidase prc